MQRGTGYRIGLVAFAVALLVGVWMFGRTAAFHLLSPGWTGEADRLAAVLAIQPGMTVADIGAGSGRLAFELARRIGPEGQVFATELDPGKREALARGARELGLRHVQAIKATERDTGLPPECCDAVFMRNVLHHIEGRRDYAGAVARAMKPGGVFVVIDFGPGAMGFLASDHGVSPEEARAAFEAAGFRLVEHVPDWGGRTYLLAFRYEPTDEGASDERESPVAPSPPEVAPRSRQALPGIKSTSQVAHAGIGLFSPTLHNTASRIRGDSHATDFLRPRATSRRCLGGSPDGLARGGANVPAFGRRHSGGG